MCIETPYISSHMGPMYIETPYISSHMGILRLPLLRIIVTWNQLFLYKKMIITN